MIWRWSKIKSPPLIYYLIISFPSFCIDISKNLLWRIGIIKSFLRTFWRSLKIYTRGAGPLGHPTTRT